MSAWPEAAYVVQQVQSALDLQKQISALSETVGDMNAVLTVTFPASGWTEISDNSGRFIQTVTVDGITDKTDIIMSADQGAMKNDDLATEFAYIYYGVTGKNFITVYADTKPDIDLQVKIGMLSVV